MMKIAYICVSMLIILMHLFLIMKTWGEDRKLAALMLLGGVLWAGLCIHIFETAQFEETVNCFFELYTMLVFGFIIFIPLGRRKKFEREGCSDGKKENEIK